MNRIASLVLLLCAVVAHSNVEPDRVEVSNILGTQSTAATAGSCAGNARQRAARNENACNNRGGTWTPGSQAQSATGLYELVDFVAIGLVVLLGLYLTYAGFDMVRNFIYAIKGDPHGYYRGYTKEDDDYDRSIANLDNTIDDILDRQRRGK